MDAVSPEQVLGGVADGRPGGRSSAHVGDPPQGADGVLFAGVIEQAELQPLVVGELDRTCSADTHQSVSGSEPERARSP